MRYTPLHSEYARSGGKVVDFHGWALPVQFSGIVQEHLHTRRKTALFDCSHMGEFVITGEEAIHAFDGLVCGDMVNLAVGRCRYSAVLNAQGGMIDDVIAMRLAPEVLYAVTNGGPLEQVSALLTTAHPHIRDVSDETAKIDVQGPTSRDVLRRLGFAAVDSLRFYQATRCPWEGTDVVLSRTGYTGELGFELYVPNDRAVALWRALLEQEGVLPAGLGARDTLRTEMGYPLSGQDFDESRTPLEASMVRFIAWDKEFVGRDALMAQREHGGYDVLVAIQTDDRRAPRHGFEISADGVAVGTVTSGTFGPSVGHGIGLAYVRPDKGAPGTALTAGPKALPIVTATLPFYTSGTYRD